LIHFYKRWFPTPARLEGTVEEVGPVDS